MKALYEQDPAAEKYAQQGIVLGRLAFDVYRRFFVSSSDQTLQQMLQREESKLAAITPSKAATSYGVGMTVKSTPLSSSSPPSTSVAKTASPRGDSPSIVSQLPRPKKAIKRRDIPAEAPASTSPVPLHVKAQSVPTLPTSSPPSTPPTTASTAPPAAGSPLVSTAPTPVSPTPTTVSSALAPTSTPTLVSAPLAPAPAVLLAPVPLPASASTPVAPPSPEQTQPRLPVSSSEPALPRPPPGQPGHMYNVRISASTSVLPETDRKDIHPPTHSSLASSAPSTAALEEEIPPPPPPQDDVLPPPPPPPELPRNNSAKFGVSAVAPEAGAQRKAFAPEKQLIRTFTTPIQFAGQEGESFLSLTESFFLSLTLSSCMLSFLLQSQNEDVLFLHPISTQVLEEESQPLLLVASCLSTQSLHKNNKAVVSYNL